MPTLPLSTINGTRRETCVALAANLAIAVGLSGECGEGRFDEPTAETKHQVQCGFLLNIVVGQRAVILQLLAGKDEALLVFRDALLVLNLGLHIANAV